MKRVIPLINVFGSNKFNNNLDKECYFLGDGDLLRKNLSGAPAARRAVKCSSVVNRAMLFGSG